MPRVSKSQTYAVRWLDHESKTSEDIAVELKLSLKQVKSILEKYGRPQGSVKTKQAPVSAVKQMMSAQTSAKTGVTIMTGEASQAIENEKPNSKNNPLVSDRSSYIHNPNQ